MSSSINNRLGISPEEGIKAPVRATATTNITLAGQQTVATVALVAGDRCLVAGQTDAAENGIYVVTTGDWVRRDELVNGAVVVDDAAGILYQASFTGDYEAGTTSVTFGSVDDSVETYTGKVIVVADHTLTTAASGNLAATELNAALAELDADITTATEAIETVENSAINSEGVTYENLNANSDIGFGAGQVPQGDLVMRTTYVGADAAWKATQVDQDVTATLGITGVDIIILGTSLNHTLSDFGSVGAFYGVAGVTYHIRAISTGTLITEGVFNKPGFNPLIILQSEKNVSVAVGDTFDVEMITDVTCRIKNYHRANGSTLRAPDVPTFRAHAVGPTPLSGGSVYDKVLLQEVDFDTSGDFYTQTSRFIPRVPGYYHIIGNVTCETDTYVLGMRLHKNNVQVTAGTPLAAAKRSQVEDIIFMNGTTDYIEMRVNSATAQDVLDIPTGTFLSGYLIRRT
jgi:hypothetical protein